MTLEEAATSCHVTDGQTAQVPAAVSCSLSPSGRPVADAIGRYLFARQIRLLQWMQTRAAFA